MRSVLTVSIAFPPKFDSEGLQVAKYYEYLGQACEGHLNLDVVTSAIPTLNMHYDPALESATKGIRQTIPIRVFENKYTNYLLRRFWPTLAFSPDSKFTFHWQWRSVIRRLREKPSLIYSRSFPASSAIMALKLKRYYRVPWVMHLSDPWADDHDAAYRGKAQALNHKLERTVFEEADVISLTSHKTIEFYRKKYPELNKRYEFFPNVYDPVDIPERKAPTSPQGRRLRLVHTGGLAGTRTPAPFLNALDQLSESAQNQLEVIFAGWVDRESRKIIERTKASCFRYLGPLDSYKDAIELQQSADVLVLIDFPVAKPDLRVYFLSKLLDYQITGKPILGITDKGSECQNFIESERGHCFERSNVQGIRKYLEWLIEIKDQEDSSFFELRPLRTEYDASINANRLAQLFDELT